MYRHKSKIVILLVFLLLITVISTQALDVPLALNACDAAPAGWPTDVVDRLGFCVYYDEGNGVGESSAAQAEQFADDLQEQVDVYATYGWPSPVPFLTKWQARLLEVGTNCNGVVFPGATNDELTVREGCVPGSILGRNVAGHEFDHLAVQLRGTVNNFDEIWFHEGMARSGEDKKLADSDHYVAALADPFTYEREVNDYLDDTNRDITTISYESVLWWTYFAEQCGSTPNDEVGRGVADSFLQLWESALTRDSLTALNHALSNLGCPNWDTMFQDFAVAIYTKDLSGLPDDSYNFLDEDEAGNLYAYGPLAPNDGGTIDSGTSATFNNRNIRRYGVAHFSAAPDAADCLVPVVSFHNDNPGTPAFYDVIVENPGDAFGGHFHGNGTDWSVAFLNGTGADQITGLVGSAGSLSSASPSVDIEFSCASPNLNILQSTQLSPDHVQSGDLSVVLVRVTDGAPTSPVVGGLSNSDFDVSIGGSPALVVSGGFTGEIYALLVQVPNLANGPYTLQVDLEQPGTSTVIATDSELEAIIYDNTRVDNVLIMDRSGSMAGDKIIAAKAALNLFKDASNSFEGLAAVAYNHDLDPVPVVDMAFGTLPQRNDVEAYIAGLTASGGTSIGDGLAEAVDQCDTSPTGNTECIMILASDGQENSPLSVVDVMADVIAAGKVLALSIGPGANETLMQDIATDTGGAAYYVDTTTSSAAAQSLRSPDAVDYTVDDMALALGRTYLTMQGAGEGRQEFLNEKAIMPAFGKPQRHTVMIDEFTKQALFVLDWNRPRTQMILQLQKPNGDIIEASKGNPYDIADYYPNLHLGWRIDDPEPGKWTMIVSTFEDIPSSTVNHQSPETGDLAPAASDQLNARVPIPYQVTVGGQSPLEAFILPVSRRQLSTGELVHLCALFPKELRGVNKISGVVNMRANVTAPNGLLSTVPFHDDGLHSDGRPDDGLSCGFYTLGNQANQVPSDPEEGFKTPPPLDEGSYIIDLNVVNEQSTRNVLAAITLEEGEDANNDGIPDSWNEKFGPSNADPDLDLLKTGDEYFAGTLPFLSDTDGGGENDGSEILKGLDPLDPADDKIVAPEFFSSTPKDGGSVLLKFDVKKGYVRTVIYRSTNPNGPWKLLAEVDIDNDEKSGEYEDKDTSIGTEYFYRFKAANKDDHWTRVLDNKGMAMEDAVLPEAALLINGGAIVTSDLAVSLSFIANEDTDAFDDIVRVKIANSTDELDGASYQKFKQGIPWNLAADTKPGEMAMVYVRFKDDGGNESSGSDSAGIIFQPGDPDPKYKINLPAIIR